MKKLHPNNIHNNGYDFSKLIQTVPSLSELILERHGKETLDFSNPKAVRALNKALLKTHYNIKYWEYPEDNLCPPIPGRADYIHHLGDLLDKKEGVRILDIGTGATLIYPLIGNAVYNWTFVGSDIDAKSIKNAQKIIDKNDLNSQITIRLQKEQTQILNGILEEDEYFDISMCNPPFYKSLEEANSHNNRKNTNLKTKQQRNFSGTNTEIIYPGGEHRFLNTYIYESSFHKEKCGWYTSLVSRKEGVKTLEKSASKLNFDKFKVIPMKQGNKETRIVCWGMNL